MRMMQRNLYRACTIGVAVAFAISVYLVGGQVRGLPIPGLLQPSYVGAPGTPLVEIVGLAYQGQITSIHVMRGQTRTFLFVPVEQDAPSFTAMTRSHRVLHGTLAPGQDLRLILTQQGISHADRLVTGS